MKMKLNLASSLLELACIGGQAVLAQNVPSTAIWPLLTDGTVQNSGRVTGTPEFITSNLVFGSYAASGTNYYTQRIKMNAWPTGQLSQLDTVYV